MLMREVSVLPQLDHWPSPVGMFDKSIVGPELSVDVLLMFSGRQDELWEMSLV